MAKKDTATHTARGRRVDLLVVEVTVERMTDEEARDRESDARKREREHMRECVYRDRN